MGRRRVNVTPRSDFEIVEADHIKKIDTAGVCNSIGAGPAHDILATATCYGRRT